MDNHVVGVDQAVKLALVIVDELVEITPEDMWPSAGAADGVRRVSKLIWRYVELYNDGVQPEQMKHLQDEIAAANVWKSIPVKTNGRVLLRHTWQMAMCALGTTLNALYRCEEDADMAANNAVANYLCHALCAIDRFGQTNPVLVETVAARCAQELDLDVETWRLFVALYKDGMTLGESIEAAELLAETGHV